MNKQILGITLAAIFSIGTAQAVIIDDFDGGVQAINSPGFDTVPYAGAIGDSRTVSITHSGPLGALAAVIFPPGIYSHSADALTSATSLITWDAAGSGLGGVNLVESLINNVFNIDILGIDQGSVSLTLSVRDTLGGTDLYTLSGAGTGIVSIAFSDFSGVDFSTVDFLSLQVEGGEASDLTLDYISTTGEQDVPPPGVPEPATLALMGLGLAGIGYRRRKAT